MKMVLFSLILIETHILCDGNVKIKLKLDESHWNQFLPNLCKYFIKTKHFEHLIPHICIASFIALKNYLTKKIK